jgi:hypothetical protein
MSGGPCDIEQMATNSYQHQQLRTPTSSSDVENPVDGRDEVGVVKDE